MLGHIKEWFYSGLSGIRYDTALIICPQIIDGINWVKSSYDAPYGKVVSNWKKENGKIILDVSIPANTTGKILLPTKNVKNIVVDNQPIPQAKYVNGITTEKEVICINVNSGKYRFIIKAM